MQIFIQVVESGSYTKASDILGVASSSISRQISRLESELNTQLLKRNSRTLQLTEAGEEYYKESCLILQNVLQLNESIKKSSDEIEGRLNISVLDSYGRMYVLPNISEFLSLHPKLKVEIELNNQVVDLYSDRYDIGIRLGRPVDSRLVARPLMLNTMALVVAPSYTKKNGEAKYPSDLKHHNCLSVSRSRQVITWKFDKNDEHIKVNISGNLSATGGYPLLEAAKQGVGYLMIPQWMVKSDLRKGTLCEVFTEWDANILGLTESTLYATHLKEHPRKKNIRAFIDFLMEKIEYQPVIQPAAKNQTI